MAHAYRCGAGVEQIGNTWIPWESDRVAAHGATASQNQNENHWYIELLPTSVRQLQLSCSMLQHVALAYELRRTYRFTVYCTLIPVLCFLTLCYVF